MKVRDRFIMLFAVQSLVAAIASVLFAFSAIAGEGARAESELGSDPSRLPRAALVALDAARPEGERLGAALDYAESLRARSAAARIYRSQAAIEAAVKIGGFSLAWAALGALAFALASGRFTRRLDELAAGAARVSLERGYRYPGTADPEFTVVFTAINEMLDRLEEQERIISETSKLEGWKEVSSFLFHQLRTPLSSIELASRNVRLAAGTGSASPALEACASSAETALAELLRIRILLDRFKSLSGLALSTPAPLDPAELVASIAARIAPDRARIRFGGECRSLLVDRRMTEEALLNLVINAAEACPEPPARVSIEASLAGGFAQLEISDANGPVDPGLFARSGRERFTTKPEGTGLGLLFVRRVVALHGGSFELFPGEDGGFRVRLGLPLAQDQGAAGQSKEDADEDSRPGR